MGDAVNIAARIEPLAAGGGICLTETVAAQVRNKLGLVELGTGRLTTVERVAA